MDGAFRERNSQNAPILFGSIRGEPTKYNPIIKEEII